MRAAGPAEPTVAMRTGCPGSARRASGARLDITAVVDLSCVSLLHTDRECELVNAAECPPGHTFLLIFIFSLNEIANEGEDDEAFDSPYQDEWDQMGRSQMLQVLIEFVVSMDPASVLAEELAGEGFFD